MKKSLSTQTLTLFVCNSRNVITCSNDQLAVSPNRILLLQHQDGSCDFSRQTVLPIKVGPMHIRLPVFRHLYLGTYCPKCKNCQVHHPALSSSSSCQPLIQFKKAVMGGAEWCWMVHLCSPSTAKCQRSIHQGQLPSVRGALVLRTYCIALVSFDKS